MSHVPAWLTRDPDWQSVAGLSLPSKMPGYAYGLPAESCLTGTKLRSVAGSTCHKCYAYKRGNYRFANVVAVQRRRLGKVIEDTALWAESMVRLIPKVCSVADPVFRWHDSGDLQSVAHLAAVVLIAERLPEIRFWIPTREYAMVRDWLLLGRSFPKNLTVRMSVALVGMKPSVRPELAARGVQTSSVGAGVGFLCGAHTRDNHCGPCRACWSKDVPNVDYPLH